MRLSVSEEVEGDTVRICDNDLIILDPEETDIAVLRGGGIGF
jgi:SepF-like predicted cell division protein (DUF552 family)